MLRLSTLTNTVEKVYEDPDDPSLDNNYEDPERMDIYRTMSNVPLVKQQYGSSKKCHCAD